jgi:exosortase
VDIEKEEQRKTLNYKSVLYLTIVVLALGLVYSPTLRWLVNSWLSSDYYSHGFLVPLVSAAIVWTKCEQLKIREPSLFGIFWIVPAIVLYALCMLLEVRVLGAFSLLSVIIGLIWLFFGPTAIRTVAFALVFLLFLIPFPFVPDLAYRLQEVSVFSSSHLLEIFGLPITSIGAEIYLQTNVFTVGIPCSGINSLIALLALSAVYAYILRGPLGKRIGLFILAFPIAIIANILRIVSIIMVAYFHDVQTAAGWYHDISSPLSFLISFLVLILIGWIMRLKIDYGLLRKQG